MSIIATRSLTLITRIKIIVHCSLLIFLSSCDLFTGPKVDVFQQISEEVDWAHAAKLYHGNVYPNKRG